MNLQRICRICSSFIVSCKLRYEKYSSPWLAFEHSARTLMMSLMWMASRRRSSAYSRQNKINTDSKGFLETKSRSEGFLQTESRFMSFLANKIAIFKGCSRRNRPWTINFCNSDFVSIDPFESRFCLWTLRNPLESIDFILSPSVWESTGNA